MRSRKAPQKATVAGDPNRAWRGHLPAVAALWTLALAAYSSSFSAGLVFDNSLLILTDSRIQAATPQNAALILGREYWYGVSTSNLYRPLTTLSYLFNYAVLGNGPDPAGYHWVNFALHAVNIALVYVLGLWILGELRGAAAMTAIWAVHPVLTESITNVVGRADLLAAFGVLGALACHIQAGRIAGWRKVWWLAALCLATALGMFSKEAAIAAPAVLVLYDLTFESRSAWRGRLVNYAAASLPCLAFLFVRGQVLAKTLLVLTPYTDNPLTGADFWTARLTALRVIGKYVALLFWPETLSADYSYNQIPLFRADDFAALAGVAVCGALAALAVWALRRNKPIFFFVALFFVTLAPVCNVFLSIGAIMAERFLYLPALGFAACATIGLRAASQRLPGGAAPMALIAICAAFAVRTYIRNLDWATDRTLMASAAAASPASFKPHAALATLLSGSAAVAEADRMRAILDPLPDAKNSVQAYLNAGLCYRTEGDRVASKDTKGAERLYRKALDALVRGRAIERVYDRLNQQENLRRGKGKSSFGWNEVYLELGRTYLRLSQPSEALDAFRQGRLRALRPEFFEEISNAYQAMGDSRQAAVALFEGVSMDTSQTQMASSLVDLYRKTEPRSCAVRESGGSRSLNMDCPLVKEHLCTALRDLSRLYAAAGRPVDAARSEGLASREMGCPTE